MIYIFINIILKQKNFIFFSNLFIQTCSFKFFLHLKLLYFRTKQINLPAFKESKLSGRSVEFEYVQQLQIYVDILSVLYMEFIPYMYVYDNIMYAL